MKVGLKRVGLCLLLQGCTPATPEGPDLGVVSTQVQFESVDRLGPHVFVGRVRRSVARAEGVPERTDEAVEIRWQDWDNFEYRRVAEGQLQSAVITVDARAWALRSRGRWEPREDAEPYRVDLRHSWNAWDDALEPFKDRLALVEEGTELYEGRPVRRYRVTLRPEEPEAAPSKAKRKRKLHVPAHTDKLLALDGFVWVDEGTAVRVNAEVNGEWEQDGRLRTVQLQVNRSGLGKDPGIAPPKGAQRRARPSILNEEAPLEEDEGLRMPAEDEPADGAENDNHDSNGAAEPAPTERIP